MALNIFIIILNMSISGGLAAALLILWRKISYRYIPSKFYYFLWLVLILRFTVPFNFKSVFSLLNLIKRTSEFSYGNKYVVTMEYLNYDQISGMSAFHPVNPLIFLAFIWLIFTITLLGIYVFFNLSAQKKLEYAVLYKSDIINQVKSDIGITREIDVYTSPNVLSPIISGFLKPRIILPQKELLSDEYKKYAIAHEIVHIKRYDHILKLLFFFVAAIHWFNPFIWYCFWLFNEDIEVSCDQYVLNTYGAEHKSRYAHVLVDYASRKNTFQLGYLSFAKNKVSARIEKVITYKKLSFPKTLMFTVITALIGVSASTNPVFASDYQYIPKTVYVNSTVRNQVRQFITDFTEDIRNNNTAAIMEKSTADVDYFYPVYEVFENCAMDFELEKIFYTSQSTADVYLNLTKNDGCIFPASSEKVVARVDTSKIMGGLYLDKLQSFEKYNRSNLIDHNDEAVMIVEKMIKFGLTDADNTPLNAPKIAAFCMAVAYDRGISKNRTIIPQKEVESVASEFFLFDDFSNLHKTEYYNAYDKTYLYDKSIGSFYEYEIIAFDKTEQEAIITVEFYKDPLQTQVEKTVKYKLKKV